MTPNCRSNFLPNSTHINCMTLLKTSIIIKLPSCHSLLALNSTLWLIIHSKIREEENQDTRTKYVQPLDIKKMPYFRRFVHFFLELFLPFSWPWHTLQDIKDLKFIFASFFKDWGKRGIFVNTSQYILLI